ncbi:EAL domain-containing protein [Pseudoalteromonas fenneropenaei]|uniref:EAL domain-containing protein n=1 Tax=Pseudoalteromonas fenneropenaei TaxID=1737459 RepID=A0ABV7CFC2_9GAMM
MLLLTSVVYVQEVKNGKQRVEDIAQKIAQDLDNQFAKVAELLRQGAQFNIACDDNTLQTMRTAVFEQPALSEIGMVDEQGRIRCNSFGKLDPVVQSTIPVRLQGLRYYGPIISDYLGTSAFILAMTRSDGIEVNGLIPTSWVNNVIKLPTENHVSYLAIVDTFSGVPIFKFGHYSLPLNYKPYPLLNDTAEYTGKFDDLNSKYWFALRFKAIPELGLTIAVDEIQLFNLKWSSALLSLLGSSAFFIMTLWLLNYLDRRSRNAKLQILDALAQNEFFNVYQPFYDCQSNTIIGAEVLMRWQHPVEGELGPAYFIPEAERDGSILELSIAQIERALVELEALLYDMPSFKLSFNANGYLLMQPSYRQVILWAAQQVPNLTLELTERDVLQGAELQHHLQTLSDAGVEIAIDDFGTGYSGLQYLQQFPIDLLKIDQSFVASIGTKNLQTPVLDAVIEMADKLGKKLIAEGVETSVQQRYLSRQGVNVQQGWLYAKPLRSDLFLDMLSIRLLLK